MALVAIALLYGCGPEENAGDGGGAGIGQIIDHPGGGDQPGGDEPGGDQPGGDQPGGDQPGGDQPGGDEPGGDQPGGDEPGGDQPGGGEVTPPPVSAANRAIIKPDQKYGRLTDKFFFDIKQGNQNPMKDSTAARLFGDFGLNGLRIPIYGTTSNGGHTAPGVIGDGVYDKILSSINTARSAFKGDKFYIFASKKLDDNSNHGAVPSFPAWVKDANGVVGSQYAIMLFDYISFMKAQGVEIDALGIDNETNFNEGHISAKVFAETVNALKPKLIAAGLKVPLFVGHEMYNPQRANDYWLKNLFDGKWQNTLDVYGTHYYPRHHDPNYRDALIKEFNLCQSDHKRPFWATEPHWDNDDAAKANLPWAAERAICALWDMTDLGLDAFMWWSFKWAGDYRANLMKNISLAIYNAQPCQMTDNDGVDTMTMGNIQSRAFRRGDEINAFLVNVSPNEWDAYYIQVAGHAFENATVVQWTEDGPVTGTPVSVGIADDNNFWFRLPGRSISKITFNIK